MEIHQIDRYLYPAGDEALRWFTLDRLMVPHSPVDRLAGRLPDGLRDALVAPDARVKRWHITDAGAPTDIPKDAAPDQVARVIRAFCALREVVDSERSPFDQISSHSIDRRRWVVALDYAQQPRHQLMAVLFDGHPTPEAVLKIRPSGTGGAALVNEREALERASQLPEVVRASVPRLLGWSCNERNAALLASWVGGRSVYADVYATLLPRFFVHGHFRAAIDWLIDFQDASRTRAKLDLDDEQRVATECATGRPEIEEICANAVRRIRKSVPPRTLRLVASHGDFWPRNVMLDGHASMAGIVDWERFSPRSSPFDDLFHFPATYGLAYRWYGLQNDEESWARTFLRRNHVSRAVRRFLARYCLRRGLHPLLLLPLLQLHLIKRHHDAQQRAETTDRDETVWMQGLRVLSRAGDTLFSG